MTRADWRPCRLGQPVLSSSYFVTVKLYGRTYVTIAQWSAGDARWTWYSQIDCSVIVLEPLAWAELPAPWHDTSDLEPVEEPADPRAETTRIPRSL